MISRTVLQHLLHNPEYRTQVIPFLKDEYFSGGDKIIFQIILEYVHEYNDFPSVESVGIDLSNRKITNTEFEQAKETLQTIADTPDPTTSLEWLLDRSEKFCQERAVDNALYTCLQIKDGKHKTLTKGAIPQLLSDALGVSFDINLGHDYFMNTQKQFEYYHNNAVRFPTGIRMLDYITQGGFAEKTLNLFMAPSNTGKTLIMCACAAAHLARGYNIVYYTAEMSEEEIRKRIDANLLNIPMDHLKDISWEDYEAKVGNIRNKTHGNLTIKEYPSRTATPDHFQHFMNEMKMKKQVKPDIVYVDYLNIMKSATAKMDSGSYTYIMILAGELRAFAQRNAIPVISATQTNRGGFNTNDLDLTNTSDSIGTVFEADLILGFTGSPDVPDQFRFNHLKSRYMNKDEKPIFDLGVDKAKQRLYDLEFDDSTTRKPIRSVVNNDQVAAPTKPRLTFNGFK